MTLLLNPILEGLRAAQKAAADTINPDDEVTVDDKGDQWVFEFIPRDDAMGGGAKVEVEKSNLRVIRVVRGQ